MKPAKTLFYILVSLLMLCPTMIISAVPDKITFQGQLSDENGNLLSGDHLVIFSLHDAPTAGNNIWGEQQLVSVAAGGMFTVDLGAVNPLSMSDFSSTPLYLQVQIFISGSGWETLSPRQQVQTVPYAFNSGNADMIGGKTLADLDTSYINVDGDAMTGDLNLNGDITASNVTGNITQSHGRPQHVGAYVYSNPDAVGPYGVHIAGNYAYVAADAEHSVTILDVSDPANPVFVGEITDAINLEGAGSIQVSGDYAYVANYTGDSVTVLDISDPSDPSFVATLTATGVRLLDGACSIDIAGQYAYIASADDNGVEIVDISDPSDPSHAGAIADNTDTALEGAYDIHVSGKYAYVAARDDNGVEVLDISDPSNPLHVSSIFDTDHTALGGAMAIYVSGRYAYVAASTEHGVEILEISNPNKPKHVGAIYDDDTTLLNTPRDIFVAGNYAYVTSFGEHGVQVLDVSDPANPVDAGYILDTAGTVLNGAANIQLSGKYAFVTSYNEKGLEILDIWGMEAPAASIGSLGAVNADIAENVRVGRNLTVDNAINVGEGGIKSDGPVSIRDMLTLIPRESPPQDYVDGDIYLDTDGYIYYYHNRWYQLDRSPATP